MRLFTCASVTVLQISTLLILRLETKDNWGLKGSDRVDMHRIRKLSSLLPVQTKLTNCSALVISITPPAMRCLVVL